jgi:cytoskeletal protein RodZ
MRNGRFRVMAGLAGATLCLFAVTAYAQNPTTTTTDPNAQGAVTQPTTPPADQATTPTTTTDQVSQTTTEGTTTTTTRSFPGGTLGILAVAVVVLLLLFGLFRGRDKTVIKENYVATPPVTGSRTVTTSTTTDDRMNLNSRAASGPGSNPGGGMNDPNARR